MQGGLVSQSAHAAPCQFLCVVVAPCMVLHTSVDAKIELSATTSNTVLGMFSGQCSYLRTVAHDLPPQKAGNSNMLPNLHVCRPK